MRKTLVHCLIPLLAPVVFVGGIASFVMSLPVREERGSFKGHAFSVYENRRGEVRLNIGYSFTEYVDLDGNGTCDKVETFYCAPRMGAIGRSTREPDIKEKDQFTEITNQFYSKKAHNKL